MNSDDKAGRQPSGMLVLRTLAMPSDTNPSGDIFGGWILAQMDVAGGLMASEVSKGRAVTVSVEKMSFDKPVPRCHPWSRKHQLWPTPLC